MRKAIGRAVRNPSPKPITTEIILLTKSLHRAFRSTMVARPLRTSGAKGKPRPVFSPMESRYHTARATKREISSQTLSLIAALFLIFVSLLIRHLLYLVFSLACQSCRPLVPS